MDAALVIPAAGSGERLGLGVPKALATIGGLALVRHTVERLLAASPFVETVVLAPPASVEDFRDALSGVALTSGRLRVLPGGATRQHSVGIGVAAVGEGAGLVCIHDAARPLVTPATVSRVLAAAAEHGAATVASRPSDSVREDTAGGLSRSLDRARLWLVETPQAFRRDWIVAAHRGAAEAGAAYTDDASLVEAAGHDVRIVESEGRNLKVTFRSDLALVEELLGRA